MQCKDDSVRRTPNRKRELICLCCGKTFVANDWAHRKYCTTKCRTKLNNDKQRQQKLEHQQQKNFQNTTAADTKVCRIMCPACENGKAKFPAGFTLEKGWSDTITCPKCNSQIQLHCYSHTYHTTEDFTISLFTITSGYDSYNWKIIKPAQPPLDNDLLEDIENPITSKEVV